MRITNVRPFKCIAIQKVGNGIKAKVKMVFKFQIFHLKQSFTLFCSHCVHCYDSSSRHSGLYQRPDEQENKLGKRISTEKQWYKCQNCKSKTTEKWLCFLCPLESPKQSLDLTVFENLYCTLVPQSRLTEIKRVPKQGELHLKSEMVATFEAPTILEKQNNKYLRSLET